MRALLLMSLVAIGLLVGCAVRDDQAGVSDLPARLVAANLLAGSLAAGLNDATGVGLIRPGSDGATAMLLTLTAVELALDGAGDAWRAGLPGLAESNLGAAEQQMSGLRPLVPAYSGAE